MTLTIQLTPEEEAHLREKAARAGQDAETVAHDTLMQALEWDAQDRAETLAGIQRGLADSDAGRVRPLTAFAEEMRGKFALPTHLSEEELHASA